MSGPENTFIASIHRHLPVELYRMKNHNVYNGGIADMWYSGKKTDLWIEYKFIVIPKKDSTIIDLVGGKNPPLSHLQQEWLKGRYQEGRNVGVIVGCKKGGVWFHGITWDRTYYTDFFKTLIEPRNKIAARIALMVS